MKETIKDNICEILPVFIEAICETSKFFPLLDKTAQIIFEEICFSNLIVSNIACSVFKELYDRYKKLQAQKAILMGLAIGVPIATTVLGAAYFVKKLKNNKKSREDLLLA